MRHFLAFLAFGLVFYNVSFAQDLHFKDRPLPCVDKNLPLVFHILLDEQGEQVLPDTAIEEVIAQTDSFFAPICLTMELCETRVVENFQFRTIDSIQELRELAATYNIPSKINVYVVEGFSHVTDVCGHADPGGIFGIDTTAILIQAQCHPVSQANLAHQLGHFLGLQNTHLGNEQVARVDCEIEGDSLCDTPADNYVLPRDLREYIIVEDPDEERLCRFINQEMDATGSWYCPDVGNIMSNYSSSEIECRCGFSADQYRRMAANCHEWLDGSGD